METGKSRRSSILKPQKPRNPLSDLALIEPDDVDVPVTTTRRSIASRRVSFASSNYVKEFATDLEKNTTIWDTTYEETVDKSDSTHSTHSTEITPFDTQSEKSSVPNTELTKMPENLNQSYVSMPNEATRKIGSIKYGNRKASLNFNEQGGEDIESDSSLCGTDDFENRIIETRSIQPSNNIMNASVRSSTRQINEKTITQKFIQSGQLPSENADISVKGVRDSLYLPQISTSNTGNTSCGNIFRQSHNLHFTEKENRPTQSDPTIIFPVLSHRKLCQSIIMADNQCDTLLSKVKPHCKKEEDSVLKQNESFLICNKSSTALKVNNVDNTESVQEGFVSNKSSCIMKSETVISNSTMKLTHQLSEFSTNTCKNTACVDVSNMESTPKLSAFSKSGRGLKNRTIVADENMEITQQVPIVYKNNYNAHVDGIDKTVVKGNANRTVISDENMEITQEFPAAYKNMCNINKDHIEKTIVKPNVNRTVVTDENMDITQGLPIVYKNTNYSVNQNSMGEVLVKGKMNKTIITDENMEFTQQLPTVNKSNNYKVNTHVTDEVLVKDNINKIIVTDENMEFTQLLPVYKTTNYNDKENSIGGVLVKAKTNRTITTDENMEFTQQLPSVYKTNYSMANRMGEVCVKDKINKTVITDENMEFTQLLPAVYKTNYSVVKSVGEVLVKDEINKTVITDENMEFTQQLPAACKTNYNVVNNLGEVRVKDEINKTVITDENMEFTQQLPAACKTNYNVVNSVGEVLAKDKINKTVITDEDMEFTQQLPAVYKTNYSVVNSVGEVHVKDEINKTVITDVNMEFTQQLPAACKTNYNVVNSVGQILAKDKINKTVITDENMEFTQLLPAAYKTNYSVINSIGQVHVKDTINKTIITDENMEFTQQLPAVYRSNNVNVKSTDEVLVTDKLNKTIITDEIMEFTQQLPIFTKNDTNRTINANNMNEVRVEDKSERTNVTDDNLEMKQQLPNLCKSNFNMSVDSIDHIFTKDEVHKTVVADENMEFSQQQQQLPAVYNSNHHTNVNTINDVVVRDKNKTTVADENMEFSQQLPIFYSTNDFATVNTNNEVIKVKQSNTVVEDDNTKFTQQLPCVYTNNEILIEDKTNNTIAVTENMEFSQELPDMCSRNYNAAGNTEVHVSGKLNETVLPDDNRKFNQQLPAIYINSEVLEDKLNKTTAVTENMEFRQELRVICSGNYNANENTEEEVLVSDKLNKLVLPDENREFLEQLPPDYTDYEVIVEKKRNKTFTVGKNVFNQQLPAVDNGNTSTIVNTNYPTFVKEKVSKTAVADENLEYSQQLPAVDNGNANANAVINTNHSTFIEEKMKKTVVADENMKYSQQVPAVDNGNANAVINTNHSTFIEEKIKKTVVADENMEYSQQLPVVDNGSANVNTSHATYIKDKMNKSVVVDGNMKYSQQVPAVDNGNANAVINTNHGTFIEEKMNTTVVADENMEYSQQLPAVDNGSANVNTNHATYIKDKMNKSVVVDGNMEYSQQLPSVYSGNSSATPNNNNGVLDKSKKSATAIKNMERREQQPAVCNSSYTASANTNDDVLNYNNLIPTIETSEYMNTSKQFLIADRSSCNPRNKTIMMNEDIDTTQQLSVTNFPVLKVNSVESLTKSADVVNTECMNISQTKTSFSPTQQLHNRIMENDGIAEKDAVAACSTTVGERNVECRPLSLEDENKVLQNLSTATENTVTYNDENAINPNKFEVPTADQSVFVNHSLNISTGVKNENQDSEFNKDGINITGSTPMDVDSIIMTNELPVVLKPNTGGLNTISASAISLLLSPLKCENDKGPFNSSAVGITSTDNLIVSSPLQSYKNKVKNDKSQNKEEKFFLELEDENEKKCFSSNNHEGLDNINQKLPMGNPNVKSTDVSFVLGENKCMNLSNDAFQQFHTGSNNLLKLRPSKNQNLDMFIDGEKCNEFVGGNVNNSEIQIDLEYEETKMVHKNISISKQNISCSGFKTPGSSFHTTFTPCSPGIDDTQHLINYSLTHKQPKSDFSKIIAGDLNPSFMNSKYMALSEFSSDAFPVSLETSRANQTHLVRMGLDKVKDWDVFPIAAASDQDNEVQFEDEEINKNKISGLSESTEAVCGNQNNLKVVEIDKNSDLFSDSVETIDSKQVHHAQHMELGDVINYDGHNKDKPPLLVSIEETIVEANNKEKGRNLKRPSLENIENVIVCKKAMLDEVEMTVSDITNLDESMKISTIQINRTTNISQEDITLCDDISYVNDMHTEEPLKMSFTNSIEASVSANISTFEHSVESKKLQELYTTRKQIQQSHENFMEKMAISLAAITKNSIKLAELYDEESKELSKPFKCRKFIDLKSNSDSSTECSLVEAVSDNNIAEHRSPFHMDSDDGTMDIQKVLTLKEKIEEKQKRCKHYWNALSIVDDKYEFDTLFKTIRLVVLLNPESGIVKKTNIYCNILDDSEQTALYVHNILKERLSEKVIQSAIGEQYDILTLLDYVYMNMQQIVELLNEFDRFAKRFNLEMDKDFRVTFKLVNIHLRSTWCISVDMSAMDNITENSITAYAKIGSVNEREIKRCVAGCPRGTLFLRSFINNILGYIELLKKRKTLIKAKVADII